MNDKNLYPIGTMCTLKSGRLAMVVGHDSRIDSLYSILRHKVLVLSGFKVGSTFSVSKENMDLRIIKLHNKA